MPMATIISRPIICPLIVGRARQLDALGECLGQARHGVGQTVVVSGEAGIGKSRLVSELRAEAERQAFIVLQGSCFESDRALPYAPFIDLLRAFGATHPASAIAQAIGDRAGELSKIVPDVVAALPAAAPTPPLDPPSERRRLFHALSQCFADMSAQQPLLIVLEDLRWADDTSLDCIIFLARAISNRPIMLMCTLRSDEACPELDHALAELDRARLAVDLRLPPLSDSEVASMLRAIAGSDRPVPRAFAQAVYGLTDGNPFFVEELVK
jgi:predicted ATPase